jgi:hypothetical protein
MSIPAIAELVGGPCDGERCAVPLEGFNGQSPPALLQRFFSPGARERAAGAQGAEIFYELASEPGVEPLKYRERTVVA